MIDGAKRCGDIVRDEVARLVISYKSSIQARCFVGYLQPYHRPQIL